MLVPTVLRVLDVIYPMFIATQAGMPVYPEGTSQDAEVERPQPDLPVDAAETDVVQAQLGSSGDVSDLLLSEPPVRQFMVESIHGIGRLLGPQDVVFIASSVIAEWENLYGNKIIEGVQIEETWTGKKLTFNFKPLKDSKLDGKGAIQMPEKVQLALAIHKGALVTVKPIISHQEGSDD